MLSAECGERSPAAGIGQPAVADRRSSTTGAFPAGAGDRSASGFGTSARSIKIEGPIITELAEHLGAKDQTDSGRTTQDLGVRVVLKIS
ncbi:MAG: hypothetical protein ACRDRY_10840 [Pseudonocardiaceae bacterium]